MRTNWIQYEPMNHWYRSINGLKMGQEKIKMGQEKKKKVLFCFVFYFLFLQEKTNLQM